MAHIAVRELRNNTRQVLDRVDAGETITITVDGRPAAELRKLNTRPRFVTREWFVATFATTWTGDDDLAGDNLAAEMRSLAPDTTDDLPWR